MKILASYLMLFAFVQCAQPCANTLHETKYNGFPAASTGARSRVMLLRSTLKRDIAMDGEEMEERLRGAKEFEKRNDYAVALMYLGRSSEAVEFLQKLEEEKPGNYSVAANMGTAFELSGKNLEALRWIREGIRRNADSHEGTEWLHVKILEAKIAAQKDTNYFATHSVLNLKAGDITDTIDVGDRKMPPKELMRAIQHQLTERLKFVKPPDPAVASLLFDYSAIEAAEGTLEGAKGFLWLSKDYGYPAPRIASLIADYDRRILWSGFGIWILAGAVVIGFLLFCYKRGWFVLSSRDLKTRR
jgi:hypothetical protein